MVEPDEKLVVYTLQPLDVWAALQREHVLYVDSRHPQLMPALLGEDGVACEQYQVAYDFMREQCALQLPDYDPEHYPWWAWYKVDNRNRADLRSMAHWYSTPMVRLALSLPRSQLLISDYSAWHSALNAGFHSFTRAEATAWSKEWYERVGGEIAEEVDEQGNRVPDYVYDRSKITGKLREEYAQRCRASWKKIFDLERIMTDPKAAEWRHAVATQQACFGALRLEDVAQATPFVGRRKSGR